MNTTSPPTYKSHLSQRIALLTTTNHKIFFRDFLTDVLLIVFSFSLVEYWPSIFNIVVALVIIGSRQHALAVLGHEAAHSHISKNRRLNNFIGALIGFWPLGSGFFTYKEFHLKHHRFLGTARDPELEHKHWHRPHYDMPITSKRFGWELVKDVCGVSFFYIARIGFSMRPKRVFDICGVLVFWSIALTAVFYTKLWWCLALWFGALMTTFWMFFHLRILCEHMGINDTWRLRIPVWLRVLCMPHHIGFHHEHHEWDHVPYMNLPAVRSIDQRAQVIDWQVFLGRLLTSTPFVPSGQISGFSAATLIRQSQARFPDHRELEPPPFDERLQSE